MKSTTDDIGVLVKSVERETPPARTFTHYWNRFRVGSPGKSRVACIVITLGDTRIWTPNAGVITSWTRSCAPRSRADSTPPALCRSAKVLACCHYA